MRSNTGITRRNSMYRAITVIGGVFVNIVMAFAANRLGLPLYLDTAGTIAVTAIGGLFPGMMCAMATNVLCSLFNSLSIYYVIINIVIAIFTAGFVKAGSRRAKVLLPFYLIALAVLSGGLGMLFQWGLLKGPQFEDIAQAGEVLSERTGMGYFICTILLNLGLNLVDKAITAGIAFASVALLPKQLKLAVYNSGWKQKPLSDEEISAFRRRRYKRLTIRQRITILLLFAVVSMALLMVICGLRFYSNTVRARYADNAVNAARFAAEIVDGNQVDRYLAQGKYIDQYDDQGYIDVNEMLVAYNDSIPSLTYLYVYKVSEDGCHIVFDTDPEMQNGGRIGEVIPFDDIFMDQIDDLLAGRRIDVISGHTSYGDFFTAYEPIYDAFGDTVAYAGADVSMVMVSQEIKDFMFRMLLIFSGFVILITACGLWIADYNIIYPINSMASRANDFMTDEIDQNELDEHVKKIRSLDIRTGDEVEDLYQSLCNMSFEMAEQMRDIRHYVDTATKMQSGLIITMADMVESRDSDTGAHVQKTAAYVRIILEGLKRKGYYSEKLTEKYMDDVERSAPLHDVGKINISDTILNAPRKLTDEEYKIMKTHTTAGKELMEKAISTVRGESYLKEARNMAAYHHERWDGKGYPEGLHGEVIPLSARVMAVADVFDALTSPRVYKPAFPVETALKMLQEGAGTQFDAKCVEVFMESLPEVKAVLKKYHGI
ncbi:MAG: HD domain-containing protein [Lachnospiraceae bacterium]|nr:HD domain-containing protein [Lachnospiraceae bacterium]